VERWAASMRNLDCQRELSRAPVGPSGTEQGAGGCVLELARTDILRTVTLPYAYTADLLASPKRYK